MVNYLTGRLDAVFGALADPTRRAILARLTEGEAQVTELARPFHCSLPAISKHLKILEAAQLIKREKSGRVHRLQVQREGLKEISQWMTEYELFWNERIDALKLFLENEDKDNNNTNKKED